MHNVWMIERNSDDLWFRMGAAFNFVSLGQCPRKEYYLFFWGFLRTLEAEARKSMERQLYGPQLFIRTNDVVYDKRRNLSKSANCIMS